MMEQDTRPGMRPKNILMLELRKSLRVRSKTIDDLPKIEHAAHLPTLAQASPSTRTKHSTYVLESAWTPMQVYLL